MLADDIAEAKRIVRSLRNHTQGVVQFLTAFEERLDLIDPTTREVQGQHGSNGHQETKLIRS